MCRQRLSVSLCVAAAGWLVLTGALAPGDVVGQWHFDEPPGSTVAADVLGVNHGTLNGSADFITDGVAGNALTLTQAGDGYVNLGDCFPHTGVSFSIVLWARTAPGDQTPDYFVLSRHRSTIVAGYIVGINANGPYGATDKAWFYQSTSPGGELTSSASVNDGDWHQIVVAYRAGATVSFYIDGSPDSSRSALPIGFIDAPLLVGAVDFGGTPHGLLNGDVDELQIYDHVLSADEALYLYEHPTETVCPGDFNGDGLRNQADLGELLASYNQDDGGDIDGDGDTDQADLGILLANYGADCP